jgi:DNA-directed RNA polymerase specialized sigma24 family protein
MDTNIELQEAIEEKKRFLAIMKDAQAQIKDSDDPQVRSRQRERLRIVTGMYRDACDRVKRLTPVEARKSNRPIRIVKVSADDFSYNMVSALLSAQDNAFCTWDELEGTPWGELDGSAWEELRSEVRTATNAMQLTNIIRDAYGMLTERQKEVINLRNTGLKFAAIADELGVVTSSVCRVYRNGMMKLERYIFARCYIPECVVGTQFDYVKFATTTGLLTGRQLQAIFSRSVTGASLNAFAEYQGRTKSTVWRNEQRGITRLNAGGVQFDDTLVLPTMTMDELLEISEAELCANLAIKPKDYYRYVCRGQTVGGMPRYHWEVLRRSRKGMTVPEIASELGFGEGTIKSILRLYEGVTCPPSPAGLVDYKPKKVSMGKRSKIIRQAIANDKKFGNIAENISADVYMRLLAYGNPSKRTTAESA